MKIVAVVTSYNTDRESLERNIQSYIHGVDHLIIWENTPVENSNLQGIKSLSDKIEVLSTGKNEYLARPFNKCIQWARENDYDYIMTMDQDSCFAEGAFISFKEMVETSADDAIAIFAPATTIPLVDSLPVVYVDRGSVYSSGSIYKRAMFDKMGNFNEDFAIYCLDTEICMRARKNEYKVVKFPSVYMNHSEGYRTKIPGGITINNYSAQSTYFYIRNNLFLWKMYPRNFTISMKFNFMKYHVVFRILKMIFEQDRLSKLEALFSGLWHGISRRIPLSDTVKTN